MKDLADDIIRRFLKRQPTAEDYRRIRELIDLLPPEIRTSPGAMTEIVLRAESIRQFEAIVRQASLDAQQRIDRDLQPRIDEAVYAAAKKLRQLMPIDYEEGARRLIKIVAIGALILAILAFGAGWSWAHITDRKDRERHHAASETELSRCVDAAAGAFTASARRGARATPVTSDTVRDDLIACAAEYADRRAGDR